MERSTEENGDIYDFTDKNQLQKCIDATGDDTQAYWEKQRYLTPGNIFMLTA